MSHPLDGPRAKIARAKKNLEDFHTEIEKGGTANSYGTTDDKDPDTGQPLIRLNVPDEVRYLWGTIIGDVVHNLRASLDHVVWQLIEFNLKQAKHERTDAYPIFRDIRQYVTEGLPMIHGLRADPKTIIESSQPYHEGPRFAEHPLWMLRELDDRDKHNVVNFADFAVAGRRVLKATDPHPTLTDLLNPGSSSAPLIHGAVIHRWTAEDMAAGVDMKFHVVFAVDFEKAGPGLGKPVSGTCLGLIQYVESLVETFAPYLTRPL